MMISKKKFMIFLKNIKWRIEYLFEGKFRKIFSPSFISIFFRTTFPKRVRNSLFGAYPVLRWFSDKYNQLSLEDKNDSVFFSFFDFKFLLPKEGISEGDFFDIYLKKEIFKIKESEYVLSDDSYETTDVFLQKKDFVVDAGANIGIFSMYASSVVGEEGKVFAFEPISHALKFLRKNIEINNVKNVEVIERALGSHIQDKCVFKIEPGNSFESSSNVIFNDDWKEEVVSQTTIDKEFFDKGIRVDYIKADIEGSERHMLRGAEKTIRKFKPKIAIRTYHLPDDSVVLEKLLKDFCPEYKIKKTKKTLYAWV